MKSIAWEPIVLSARDSTTQSAEQGEVRVTEDRQNPQGEITLRFVRIRSEQPKGPPAVFLSGGPGDSGIQWASHGPFLRVFQRVAQDVDLILVDQRGVGQSERNLSMRVPRVDRDDLVSRESMLTFLDRQVADCRPDDTDLHCYNVVESAHDLDDLRNSLGVDKISLWGYSYGTHLSQIATKQHGDRIERVALCGFEGPDQTFKFPSNMDAQLYRLEHLSPGLVDNVRKAIDRLESEPADVDGALFGAYAFKHLVANWLGISNRFMRLPALAASLAGGKVDVLRKNLKDYMRFWARPLTFYLTDGASGATAERWQRIRDEEPYSILGNATNFPFPEAGAMVGAGDMGDVMRKPLATNHKVLVLTGSLDGFTPTGNAIEGIQTLPNAHHILVENAAHNDLISSPEGVEAIAGFLATGQKPEIDRASIDSPS